MNKFLVFGLALVLMGAGCAGTSTSSVADSGYSVDDVGDSSRVSEVEAALDLELPSDASISVVLENDGYYSAFGYTTLIIEELKDHFVPQLESLGLTVKRDFDVVPVPNGTSALYTGNGENWAVFFREDGELQTFEIVRER